MSDDLGKSGSVDQTEGTDIRKRTPAEQALAEATDPRAAWDAKMARQGFKRKTVLTRTDSFEALRELAALLRGPNGDEHLTALKQFVAGRE